MQPNRNWVGKFRIEKPLKIDLYTFEYKDLTFGGRSFSKEGPDFLRNEMPAIPISNNVTLIKKIQLGRSISLDLCMKKMESNNMNIITKISCTLSAITVPINVEKLDLSISFDNIQPR